MVKTDPTPLLPNPYEPEQDSWKAYDQCLYLEPRAKWELLAGELQTPFSDSYAMYDLSPTIAARVLGHALVQATSETGRNTLSREIINCNGNLELLAGLAHLYVHGLIRVFMNFKDPTPAVSPDSDTRPPFRQAVQEWGSRCSSLVTSTKELRRHILLRDNNSCVLTGVREESSLLTPSDWETILDQGLGVDQTTVARIISQSLSDEIWGSSPRVQKKFEWAKSAAAIIEKFGGFSPREVLGEDDLSSPANAFLSCTSAQLPFDTLSMWLEPAQDIYRREIPNVYNVNHTIGNRYLPIIGRGVKAQVSFTPLVTDDGLFIPPPHRSLLALHAACAKVAQMSGVAKYLNDLFLDPDPIMNMTEPNAAAELTRVLTALQLTPRKPS